MVKMTIKTNMKKIIFLLLMVILNFSSYAEDKSGYVVDKTNGCKVWLEDIAGKNTQWYGECKNGFANGQGTLIVSNAWNNKKSFELIYKRIGLIIDGKPVGEAKYTYANEKNNELKNEKIAAGYLIDEKNGCKVWTGDITDRTVQWTGNCEAGFANGQGTVVMTKNGKFLFETNAIYINGKANGKGNTTLENGDKYVGEYSDGKFNGQGTGTFANGNKYIGEHKESKFNGIGTLMFANGDKYFGEWLDNKYHGMGIFLTASGAKQEGYWEEGKFIKAVTVNLPELNMNKITNINNKDIERERQQLAEERKKLVEEKRAREQARNSQRINLQISNTEPDANGVISISIKTNADTASLKINDEEQGGRADGNYSVKKVARAGQETKFTIVAVDINGNTDSKIIAVTRQITASSQVKYAELNPALVKTQPNKDAVAIIIGIAEYKNLPKAEFANDDARIFYDYAIRGLGVKAENIKLLVDADAGQGEIYKAFKTWLPSRVKATTDVYIYYSGHGLPAADGQSLYLLPQLADRDLIEETAIAQSKINAAIQAAKPKSVTIFLDSCYSGAGRTGQTLLASARPISLKATAQVFPADFTVFTASTAEQISSSSNELKHGIFSYYLMRGMEGDADTNKDGKITTGEMHSYLMDNVTRQASLANRVQQPQLSGDANKVLVGK